jgi:TolA-binding protein
LKIFQKIPNDDGAADSMYGLALATLGNGGFDEAIALFKKAQKLYKKNENHLGVASIIMDLGNA